MTYPNGAVYCATKAAERSITEGLRMDLLGTPLRVTTIDPGMVETEFSEVRFRGDKQRAARSTRTSRRSSPRTSPTPSSGPSRARARQRL